MVQDLFQLTLLSGAPHLAWSSSSCLIFNTSRDTDVPVLGRLARSPGPLPHPRACASSGGGCRIRDGWLRPAAEGNAGAMARRCRVCRSWGRGTPPARLERQDRHPRGPGGFYVLVPAAVGMHRGAWRPGHGPRSGRNLFDCPILFISSLHLHEI